MPGLLAVVPPRRTARGRERDQFIAYLMLSGNTTLSPAELMQITNEAAESFYQIHGPLTSAMRKAADQINARLLERNRSATSQGKYALGLLVLAVIRENQCTLLLSGPMHAIWVSEGQSRHIHEPALSGKGLGASQSLTAYLSKIELHPQDLLVLCGTFPRDWEADLLNERPPASLDASYRKLTFAKGDLNAVLIQAQSGHGVITVLRPQISGTRNGSLPSTPVVVSEPVPPAPAEFSNHEEQNELPAPVEIPDEEAVSAPPVITEEKLDALADFAAHIVQPSAYAIPPQPENRIPLKDEVQGTSSGTRGFPSSIPRAKPVEQPVVVEESLAQDPVTDTPVEVAPPPGRARRR